MLVGALLLTHILMGMQLPRKLILLHAACFIPGLLLLILYAILTDQPEKQVDTLVVISVTALVGLYLFLRVKKNQPVRKWLAILYQALGMAGVMWLFTYVLP
ncbi:MAG: hypothetical protein KKG00_17340 [Bacteroidetes bacterium]|nr:hypothetical protein [Bacteroidota bacterium]